MAYYSLLQSELLAVGMLYGDDFFGYLGDSVV